MVLCKRQKKKTRKDDNFERRRRRRQRRRRSRHALLWRTQKLSRTRTPKHTIEENQIECIKIECIYSIQKEDENNDMQWKQY